MVRRGVRDLTNPQEKPDEFIGARMRERRHELGISQADLAETLGG
jgi:DNA-binding XRE family transcriptional regulator